MELSPNVVRALDMVKMGLYMLYGASYFTEEEWITLDGLLHKGQYVFTSGPPQANLLDRGDELMSFDNFTEKSNRTPAAVSVDTTKGEHPEVQMPTPPPPASSFVIIERSAGTPNAASVDASSDDGSTKKDFELFDFSETTAPSSAAASSDDENTQKLTDMFSSPATTSSGSQPEDDAHNLPEPNTQVPTPPQGETDPELAVESATEPVVQQALAVEAVNEAPESSSKSFDSTRQAKPLPKEGGFALGYTQTQLEELRAFNAGLTKAGEKARSKNKRPEYREDMSSEPGYEPDWGIASSPTATENEDRIQSWASEVDANEPADVASPTPRAVLPPVTKAALVEKFVQVHGRPPKNLNDLAQPNNPNFRPLNQRSVSRASNRTSIKSTGRASSKKGPTNSQLNLTPGTILVAQSSCIATSKIQIAVQAGDKIRVIKPVSGVTHIGENMRTNLKGQFNEAIFTGNAGQAASTALIEQQRVIARRITRAPNASTGLMSDGLDRVEGMNAAEWEEESVASRPRTAVATSKIGGLANSRYALLDEVSDQQKQIEELARAEVGKMVTEKVAEILAGQTRAGQTRAGAKPSFREPLQAVVPRSETCWFWKTPGQSCRFADHECRDAHFFVPPKPGGPTNLRDGKPTWAALADCLPLPSSSTSLPPSSHAYSGDKNGLRTCWYFANDTCTNSAAECKYLHEYSAAGVAPRPPRNGWKKVGVNRSWRTEMGGTGNRDAGEEGAWGEEVEGSCVGDGEGEMVNGGDDGWGKADMVAEGESTTDVWGVAHDRYKAPHVRALEQRAAMAAVGW